MRVAIAHTTRLDYSAPVVEAVMDLRLGPLSDGHQRWDRFDLRVSPLGAVRRYTDGFGNRAHLLTLVKPHRFVEIVAEGQVQTFLADPFAPPAAPPPPLSPGELVDYVPPSPLIDRHPDLEAMAAPYRPSSPEATFDAVRALMQLVYDGFTYQQHVTTVATTVPEVLASRTGVCQDFAHVLIGLCRSVGIAARYVSGYIASSGQAQTASAPGQWQSQSQSQGAGPSPGRGAGASHAWIEAYTPTHGWRGFDPTNNLVASEHHIKMAVGRDYSDVPPTRGTFRGLGEERLSVDVVTRQLD